MNDPDMVVLLPMLLLYGCCADEKPIFFFLLGMFFSLSVQATTHGKDERLLPMTSTYSQKNLLKNWALSICFAQISKDNSNKEDAGKTAGAYLEFGHQPLEAYEDLRLIVKKYVNLKYSGSVDSDFNTMKCIDLFHSKELDQLTTKLAKRRH